MTLQSPDHLKRNAASVFIAIASTILDLYTHAQAGFCREM